MEVYHGPPAKKRRIEPPLSIDTTPSLTSASTESSTRLSPRTPEDLEFEIPKKASSPAMSSPAMSSPDISPVEAEIHQVDRYPSDLEAAGYRPVWSSTDGYPGEVPENIAEWLYPNAARYDYVIGPLSSIFWLQGVEFLNELIDDPAYVLQDEVSYLPHASGRLWIVQQLYDEGKIPARFMDRILCDHEISVASEGPTQTKELPRNSQIPRGITTSSQQFRATNLFHFARRDSTSPMISGVKINWNKQPEKLATAIETNLLTTLGDHLLFRGLSRQALLSLMAVFCPIITSSHSDNEFGPGFYATPSVQVAARYAGPNGAILVFERLPESLTKLTLSGQEWETTIRFWTGNSVSNQENRVPAGWRGTDILEGPVSKPASSRDSRRVEGPDTQVVGVSLKSFQAFSSALQMIIWID